MGNLLKDQNGNIRVLSTTIKVTVLPSRFSSDEESVSIQNTIFSYLKDTWGRAGFELELQFLDNQAQQQHRYQQLKFPPNTRTIFQQDGVFINMDSNGELDDMAYQQQKPKDSFAGESGHIHLGENREHILKADVVHEFGHALGLAHEHQRIDRDSFVSAQDTRHYQDNLSRGQQIGIDDYSLAFGSYDYQSVMHYPGIFKSKNNKFIGGSIQNSQFPENASYGDIMTARFLYNEARIKEQLDYMKKFHIKGLSKANEQRISRLKNLRDKVYQAADADEVIKFTYETVSDQCKQLNSLNLLQEMDKKLLKWAEKPYQELLAKNKQPEKKQSDDKNKSSFCLVM